MADFAAPHPQAGALEHWVRITAARWRSGLAVFLTVVLLAAGLVFLSRPVYRAEARLRIGEPPPMSGVSPAAGILSVFRTGGDPFANDLELVQSRTVAEGVVEAAALNLAIDAPRGWHRDSLFSTLSATRSAPKARYHVRAARDAAFTIQRTSPDDSAIGTVRPGHEITFGGVTVALTAGAPSFTIGVIPFGEAVRQTRGRLSAQRTRRDANVLDLAYDHGDPGLAVRVVGAAVGRFLALRATVQQRESGQTVDSLSDVAAQTLGDLKRAEAAVRGFQEQTRLVSPGDQTQALVERHTSVTTQLAQVRNELEALDRLAAAPHADAGASRPWEELVASPRFVQNQTVAGLVSQLAGLQRQRLELASRRSPENRDLRVLDEQVRQLETSLAAVVNGYRDALVNQRTGLERQMGELDSLLNAAPRLALELARRERDVRLLSETYLLTQQRLRQEELRVALTFSNVQVIDPPALRYKPVWPRKTLGLGVGLLLAGLFGLLAMAAHDRLA